jgi:hypothetical protein
LQPDQVGGVHIGERLRHLGLADAGIAFDQQRPAQHVHQQQCGRQIRVGDVANLRQSVGDLVAGQDWRHGRF